LQTAPSIEEARMATRIPRIRSTISSVGLKPTTVHGYTLTTGLLQRDGIGPITFDSDVSLVLSASAGVTPYNMQIIDSVIGRRRHGFSSTLSCSSRFH
jgi:hypothetical protein